MNRNNEFHYGVKDSTPIFLAYLAVSCAFGMTVCQQGMSPLLAGFISLTNLTSAGQFAGTELIIKGASFLELAFTILVINLRYFLMSLSLSQKLDRSFNLFQRYSVAFGVTDEIFAVSVGKPGVRTPKYMFGLILPPVIGWTGGTLLGGFLSQSLPSVIVDAMGISLYAMFLAIIIPPAKKSKPILFTIILAMVLSTILEFVPIFDFLSSGWVIIIITVVVASIAATLFPIKEEEILEDE